MTEARNELKYVVWLAFLLIALSRLVAVIDGRDPGYDQAMLMSNFPLKSLASYFQPLPYFEQGTALFSVFELDVMSRIFGAEGLARFYAVRSVAAMLAFAAYVLFWRAMRRSLPVGISLLTLALLASTNEVLQFTTNNKNYVNAFFAAMLLLTAGQAFLDDPSRRRAVLLILAGVLTCLMALTAPLIIIAIGGGLLAEVVARHLGDRAEMRRKLLALVAIGAVILAFSGVYHLLYTNTVTAFDQAAYSGRYERTFIDLTAPFSENTIGASQSILNVFFLMIEPVYFPQVLFNLGLIRLLPYIHVICAIIALIGLPYYWRKAPLLAGVLFSGGLAMLLLNALHVLPIASTRHFMFFAPFAVASFASGVSALLMWVFGLLGRSSWRHPVLYVLSFALLGLALIRSADLETTEVSEQLAIVEAYPATLWVYAGAQPSLRALRPDLMAGAKFEVVGLLNHASVPEGWQLQSRTATMDAPSPAYEASARGLLSGTQPIWLLFANYWLEERVEGGLGRYADMARDSGRECVSSVNEGTLLLFCALPDSIPFDLRERLK